MNDDVPAALDEAPDGAPGDLREAVPDDLREAIAALAAREAELRRQADALEVQLAELVEAAADANADDEHDPEGPTLAFERQQVAAVLESARGELAELAAARARIADGTYGRCESCGGPIAPARLAARPTARTCIACASRTR